MGREGRTSPARGPCIQGDVSELSDTDLRYLEAMLVDAGDSRSGDIAKRMGVSTSQAAQYRRRLIESGVIGERRRGVVGFDLPYFKEYLLSLR